MKKKILLTLAVLVLGISVTACDLDINSTESLETGQQEKTTIQAVKQVGMPNIINFTEKRFAKKIYELRDEKIRTYTYISDINGRQHFFCNSIGYGLPYSTQYSNPEKIINFSDVFPYSGDSPQTIPQAEPNGLYMPDSAEGTWVACIDKKSNVQPVYVEPRIIVSPFKLGVN